MKHNLISFIFASLAYCSPTFDEDTLPDVASGLKVESEPVIDMENSRYYGRLVTTGGPAHHIKSTASFIDSILEDKPSDESLTEEQMEWFLHTYFPELRDENHESSQPKSAAVEQDKKAGTKRKSKTRRNAKRRKTYAEYDY